MIESRKYMPYNKKYKKKETVDKPDVEIVDNPRFYDSKGRNLQLEKIGRPSKITEEIIDQVVFALSHGAYIETAMNFVGIDRARFYEWNKRAMDELKARDNAIEQGINREDKDEIFVAFHNAIQKALAESELMDLKTISDAARRGNWQAAAWRLERKHPDRYGINSLRISTGEADLTNSKVEIVVSNQSNDKRIEEMEKAIIDEIKGSK